MLSLKKTDEDMRSSPASSPESSPTRTPSPLDSGFSSSNFENDNSPVKFTTLDDVQTPADMASWAVENPNVSSNSFVGTVASNSFRKLSTTIRKSSVSEGNSPSMHEPKSPSRLKRAVTTSQSSQRKQTLASGTAPDLDMLPSPHEIRVDKALEYIGKKRAALNRHEGLLEEIIKYSRFALPYLKNLAKEKARHQPWGYEPNPDEGDIFPKEELVFGDWRNFINFLLLFHKEKFAGDICQDESALSEEEETYSSQVKSIFDMGEKHFKSFQDRDMSKDPKIENLDLSNLFLPGIPKRLQPHLHYLSEEFIEYFSFLKHLNLSHNSLRSFRKDANDGKGDLSDFKRLETLDLSHNDLFYLPPELFKLSNLHKLDLSYNDLQLIFTQNPFDSIKNTLRSLRSLKELSLAHNRLILLPEQISQIPRLKVLDVSYNDLETLPSSCGTIRTLQCLKASYNQLGEIPDWIENLSRLEELKWAGNGTTTLPLGLEKLQELQQLDLSNNPLNHTAAQVFIWFPKLSFLDLSNTRFCNGYFENLGSMSLWFYGFHGIGSFDTLTSLNLSDNKLSSIYPLGVLFPNMQEFYSAGNQLKDIPSWMSDWEKIKVLDFSRNEIEEFPFYLTKLTLLESLTLHHNQIQHLPIGIGNMKALKELDLSRNELRSIPGKLYELENLESLDLSHNLLESFPGEEGRLRGLKKLNLSYNKLETLPEIFIRQLESLEEIDLSYNQIVEIPEALFSLPNLKRINLSGNKIGYVSIELFRAKKLEKIDLSDNKIRFLPFEFTSKGAQAVYLQEVVSSVEYLDLSHNNVFLQYPDYSKENSQNHFSKQDECKRSFAMPNLKYFGLLGNNITNVPAGVFSLPSLQTLDLSENRIEDLIFDESTGTVIGGQGDFSTKEMVARDSLERLFLHQNQFNKFPKRCLRLFRYLTDVSLYKNPFIIDDFKIPVVKEEVEAYFPFLEIIDIIPPEADPSLVKARSFVSIGNLQSRSSEDIHSQIQIADLSNNALKKSVNVESENHGEMKKIHPEISSEEIKKLFKATSEKNVREEKPSTLHAKRISKEEFDKSVASIPRYIKPEPKTSLPTLKEPNHSTGMINKRTYSVSSDSSDAQMDKTSDDKEETSIISKSSGKRKKRSKKGSKLVTDDSIPEADIFTIQW